PIVSLIVLLPTASPSRPKLHGAIAPRALNPSLSICPNYRSSASALSSTIFSRNTPSSATTPAAFPASSSNNSSAASAHSHFLVCLGFDDVNESVPPTPPPVCMNVKTRDLQNLHFVSG